MKVNYSKDAIRLVLSLAVCYLAAVAGSFFTASSVSTWYAGLAKPWFTPSGQFISIVWAILFGMMGVSLFLVWRLDGPIARTAMLAFAAQLVANVAWSAAFFGARSPLGGIVVIVILWLLIANTIIKFKTVSETAAFLLVPYILWVTVAGFLNFNLWIMNR
jgi:tryptophan-rich sensory protein